MNRHLKKIFTSTEAKKAYLNTLKEVFEVFEEEFLIECESSKLPTPYQFFRWLEEELWRKNTNLQKQ